MSKQKKNHNELQTKCKTKGELVFIKFKGDKEIYANCQNYGFVQDRVYDMNDLFNEEVDKVGYDD